MKTITTLAALMFVAACGSKPSSPPAAAPASNAGADAGTTSTTSGSVDEPNSPNMTNSGTPNPPGRGDPPQLIPPEIAPK